MRRAGQVQPSALRRVNFHQIEQDVAAIVERLHAHAEPVNGINSIIPG